MPTSKNNDNKSGSSLLLDRPPPEGYGKEWLETLKTLPLKDPEGIAVLIFRIRNEWLALKTSTIKEITDVNFIHRIPHRTTNVLLGITNVQGELRLTVSLQALLGIEESSSTQSSLSHRIYPRMLAIGKGNDDFVFPVSEVYGISQIPKAKLQKAPLNLSQSLASYTTSIFQFNDLNVGLLDEAQIISSLNEKHL